MKIMPTQLDRLRGCIIGGALGDTIGLFTEGLSKQQALGIYGPRPAFSLAPRSQTGGPEAVSLADSDGREQKWRHMDHSRAIYPPNGWTDDTDQTLLILFSFLRSGGKRLDPMDFAKRLRHWAQNGMRLLQKPPLGLGKTVGAVVATPDYLDDPFAAATLKWEAGGKKIASNGAVMRTAIIGALVYKSTNESGYDVTFRVAIDLALTTHADPRCLISSAIVSGLVCAIMNGDIHAEEDIRPLVGRVLRFLRSHYPVDRHPSPTQLEELDAHIWAPSLESLHLDDEDTMGYTYKTLGAGLWAFREVMKMHPLDTQHSASILPQIFDTLITKITMAGGDADTNSTVAGSLLGAWMGYDNLPPHWVNHLDHQPWLLAKADAAGNLLGLDRYDWEFDSDTLMPESMIEGQVSAMWDDAFQRMEERLSDNAD